MICTPMPTIGLLRSNDSGSEGLRVFGGEGPSVEAQNILVIGNLKNKEFSTDFDIVSQSVSTLISAELGIRRHSSPRTVTNPGRPLFHGDALHLPLSLHVDITT